jgi:hypothetical protein
MMRLGRPNILLSEGKMYKTFAQASPCLILNTSAEGALHLGHQDIYNYVKCNQCKSALTTFLSSPVPQT